MKKKKRFLMGIAHIGVTPRAGQRATWSFFSAVKNDIQRVLQNQILIENDDENDDDNGDNFDV